MNNIAMQDIKRV